jgi:hypothetical protein
MLRFVNPNVELLGKARTKRNRRPGIRAAIIMGGSKAGLQVWSFGTPNFSFNTGFGGRFL